MVQEDKKIARKNFLFNNTIIFAVSVFGTKILSLFLLPLYTKVLSSAQYGQIDITITINSLLPYFLTLCISDAVLKFVIDNRDEKNKILTLGIKIISIGFGILILVVSSLYFLNVINDRNSYLLFLLLLYPFESFRTLFSSYLKAIEKVKDILVESLVTALLTIGCTIITVVYFKMGVFGYLISQAIGLLFGCGYYFLRIRKISGKILEPGLTKELRKQMILYSLPLILNGISWWINSGSDKFIITLFCGESENGIYAVAGKIPSILTLITSVFAQSWTLSAFKSRGDDDYDSFFSSIYNKYNAFLMIGASALILFNKPLSKFLYSNEFFIANKIASILVVAVLFNSLAGCLSGAFSAFNKNGTIATTTIISAIVNIVLNFLLIPKYGGVGAAIATLISFFTLWILRLVLSRKNVKIKVNIFATIITYALIILQLICDHTKSRYYIIQLLIFVILLLIYFRHIKTLIKTVLEKARIIFEKRKRCMTYDFLLLYEVKNREAETICLLKYELERRGYSVVVRETWRDIHYPYKRVNAKVVITFALYDDNQVRYISEFASGVKKIVNLQWEQLYTIGDELDSEGLYTIKELAAKSTHICWGKYRYDNLISKSKVADYNLILSGQPSFDFCKPKFNGYFKSREELFNEMGLENNKKTYLFISSFSYVDMTESTLTNGVYTKLAFNPLDFQNVSIKSQKEILKWIKSTLEKFPEVNFIYRPHPAEIGNKSLEEMQEKYENFKVIRDYSIKQWILCCDKIYTWYSTSIAEIYLANKTCTVLRPYDIEENMEIRIYKDGKFITNQKEFEKDYLIENKKFPLNKEMINYYYNFTDEYSYIIICNKLEEILRDDKYVVNYSSVMIPEKNFKGIRLLKRKIKALIKRIFSKNKFVKKLFGRSKKFANIIKNEEFTKRMIENNYLSDQEINAIQNRIKAVILSNEEIK